MITNGEDFVEKDQNGITVKSAVDLRGLSYDEKPTDVANGSTFFEMDSGNMYTFDQENLRWRPLDAEAVTPTEADELRQDIHEVSVKVDNKLERVVLYLSQSGSTYSLKDADDAAVTFEQLYNLVKDESKYVVILFGNSKLRPQYVSTSEIHCDGEDRDSQSTQFLRMIMTPTRLDYQMTRQQDKLTAGTNITINGNVISATGGGGGGESRKVINVALTMVGYDFSNVGYSFSDESGNPLTFEHTVEFIKAGNVKFVISNDLLARYMPEVYAAVNTQLDIKLSYDPSGEGISEFWAIALVNRINKVSAAIDSYDRASDLVEYARVKFRSTGTCEVTFDYHQDPILTQYIDDESEDENEDYLVPSVTALKEYVGSHSGGGSAIKYFVYDPGDGVLYDYDDNECGYNDIVDMFENGNPVGGVYYYDEDGAFSRLYQMVQYNHNNAEVIFSCIEGNPYADEAKYHYLVLKADGITLYDYKKAVTPEEG